MGTIRRKVLSAGLQRIPFEMSRATEYLTLDELQTMTGQNRDRFAAVVIKELCDNGMDSAEAAGVAPKLQIRLDHQDKLTRIEIADNGRGLPPEVVRRILNFDTRTSDKACYRAPTRGRLGNALKTVLGMPFAFGIEEPVTIEAQGVRHVVQARLDAAGQLRVNHAHDKVRRGKGTTISVTLPADAFGGYYWGRSVDAALWAQAFSLFNPHASVYFSENGGPSKHANGQARKNARNSVLYRPSVCFPDAWRKFLPTDNTSPWWYDENSLGRLIFAHVAHARGDGEDRLLRDFVRDFRGLTMSGKAKEVCDRLPTINRLSDFESREHRIAELLKTMQKTASKQPGPSILGCVGEEHFRLCFDEWGSRCKRHWYRRVQETCDNLPYVVEVFVAETEKSCGKPFTGINFSPSFDDPLMGCPLASHKIGSYGLRGFLEAAHASSAAVAFHIVCPHLSIQDKGKTRVDLPPEIAQHVADALWRVTKQLYQEGERRKRDAARQERTDEERDRRERAAQMPLNRAIELVMPEAVSKASGNGTLPVSAHTLFYHVRPLVQEYNSRKQLKPSYFEQQLLPEYQQKHGAIPGLYYEPRGTLYEPHSGVSIPLGTREVADYRFPSWLYDKILYVEKQGLWPVFKHAKLAEKFDMAIVAGEGYATEACRVLFDGAEKGRRFRLAVLHDGDPYGYNIARTLREETARMPGYSVEVIDIGLRLADALDMGLEVETFTRKKALPKELAPLLTDLEQEYFVGRRTSDGYICRRVELNAMTSPQLITYTEKQLRAAGIRGKVIPDDASLLELARKIYHGVAKDELSAALDQLLDRDHLLNELADSRTAKAKLASARRWIVAAIRNDPTTSWKSALRARCREMLAEREPMRELLQTRLAERFGAV